MHYNIICKRFLMFMFHHSFSHLKADAQERIQRIASVLRDILDPRAADAGHLFGRQQQQISTV